MQTDGQTYFSANDLAARFRVHPVTIWKWVRAGLLPQPVKLGPNTTRWHADQIKQFEASRPKKSA